MSPLPVTCWEDDCLFRIFPLSYLTDVAHRKTLEKLAAFVPAYIPEKLGRTHNTNSIIFPFEIKTLRDTYKPNNTGKNDRRKTASRNTLNAKNRISRQFLSQQNRPVPRCDGCCLAQSPKAQRAQWPATPPPIR
jgi:hypothetical protein